MLQDMPFGRLENEYTPCAPRAEDPVVCVRGREILIRKNPDGTLTLPTAAQAEQWSGSWDSWGNEPLRYGFRMDGKNYFLWMGISGDCERAQFHYEGIWTLRQRLEGKLLTAELPGLKRRRGVASPD